MSDRDELAGLIYDALDASEATDADGAHISYGPSENAADAILARWRLVPVLHPNPLIDDILRAKATVDAAPAYRCDCVTCRNEPIVACYICGRQDGANPCRTCEPA